MKPTIGRIVLYRVSSDDAAAISAQRERLGMRGNPIAEGEEVPAVIVRVFENEFGPGIPGCNLKLMLDGEDDYWATSRREGVERNTWHWPKIEKPGDLTKEAIR